MSEPLFRIRRSTIHGLGAFAVRRIRKGVRVIEYAGDRITPKEADARYDDDQNPLGRVLLFTVDRRTVIDAGRGGNAARFINHSCDPNCESLIEDGRVFIETIREIALGEELTYDYHLQREGISLSGARRLYPCHCGSKKCRGTLMDPVKKRRRSEPARADRSRSQPRRGRRLVPAKSRRKDLSEKSRAPSPPLG
ncbi:MAG: SET domain-containing protein-lysine N-methyltransferase [Anaerolineales bacterium]|jgi:SET domain-containing protein